MAIENILLSIITVNRDNATGLKKTIESVVSQKSGIIEYIIIDGASSDISVDILKEYDQYIDYWVSELDAGIYNAMNKGIRKAKGRYCLFLNSGDRLVEHAIQGSLQALHGDRDVFYGDCLLVYGKRIKKYRQPSSVSPFFFYSSTLNHQSCLIKTELLRQAPYDESFRILADQNWFIWASLHDKSFMHIDIRIAYYDMFGVSSTNTSLSDQERARILDTYLPKPVQKDYATMRELLSDPWSTYRDVVNKHRYIKKLMLIVLRIARLLDRLSGK